MLAKRGWTLLFLAIAAFYLYGLGVLPLVGPDEPRYAEVAREMFVRRDFITPTLGGLPWFEKPPLLYWLMMASYRLLGVSEYAARLGPAISGLVTAAFVYWIGKNIENSGSVQDSSSMNAAESDQKRHDGLGRFSALIWLSSLGAIVFSHGASFDIVVTMTVTAALACFFVWHVRSVSDGVSSDNRKASARQNLLLFGFYFFIGASLLAKGLVGIVIPLGVVAVYFLLRREWPNRSFMLSLVWGIPLILVVAAVWYGPMIARHGWKFIDQFIVQHHFARFVTNKYHHPEPFYFYALVLVALSLPWTIVLVRAFVSAVRWKWRGETPLDRLRVFAFAWIVFAVVFFSFSQSKLTAYILPVLPAAALLVAGQFTSLWRAHSRARLIRLTGVLLIGLGAVGGWYAGRNFGVGAYRIGAAATPLLAVGVAALVRPQISKTLFALIPLAMIASSTIAINYVAPVAAPPHSVRDLLAAAAARGYGAMPVVQLHTIERTAEFYAADRMSYGSDGEPIKFEGASQVVNAARRRGGQVLCFVPMEYQSQITADEDAQTEVIGNNGRVSLVAVRVP